MWRSPSLTERSMSALLICPALFTCQRLQLHLELVVPITLLDKKKQVLSQRFSTHGHNHHHDLDIVLKLLPVSCGYSGTRPSNASIFSSSLPPLMSDFKTLMRRITLNSLVLGSQLPPGLKSSARRDPLHDHQRKSCAHRNESPMQLRP